MPKLTCNNPISLKGIPQNYSWGKHGSSSLISKLLEAFDEGLPYAELWFGAHPKAPATALVQNTGYPLDELIQGNPLEILGPKQETLAFLFKILSIAQPLSIQAHPDKELAEKLHEQDPENYPDANHKPEIAIALSDTVLLSGFRPFDETAKLLKDFPELIPLLGESLYKRIVATPSESELKELLNTLFNQTNTQCKETGQAIFKKLSTNKSSEHNLTYKWLVKLIELYPEGDPGVYSVLFMNIISLKAGQALFTGPNTLHAYLDGDLVECMTNSDNVVRAGLTPKYKDVKTLLGMLDYKAQPTELLIPSKTDNTPIAYYPCQTEEFQIGVLKGTTQSFDFDNSRGPTLFYCFEGEVVIENHSIQTGDAILIPAAIPTVSVSSREACLYVTTCS